MDLTDRLHQHEGNMLACLLACVAVDPNKAVRSGHVRCDDKAAGTMCPPGEGFRVCPRKSHGLTSAGGVPAFGYGKAEMQLYEAPELWTTLWMGTLCGGPSCRTRFKAIRSKLWAVARISAQVRALRVARVKALR